jgi:hypothetical protein
LKPLDYYLTPRESNYALNQSYCVVPVGISSCRTCTEKPAIHVFSNYHPFGCLYSYDVV